MLSHPNWAQNWNPPASASRSAETLGTEYHARPQWFSGFSKHGMTICCSNATLHYIRKKNQSCAHPHRRVHTNVHSSPEMLTPTRPSPVGGRQPPAARHGTTQWERAQHYVDHSTLGPEGAAQEGLSESGHAGNSRTWLGSGSVAEPWASTGGALGSKPISQRRH